MDITIKKFKIHLCNRYQEHFKFLPKLPTQHFAASKSGVCKINCFKLLSYKAVVLISLVLVPCETSVSAKQPGI